MCKENGCKCAEKKDDVNQPTDKNTDWQKEYPVFEAAREFQQLVLKEYKDGNINAETLSAIDELMTKLDILSHMTKPVRNSKDVGPIITEFLNELSLSTCRHLNSIDIGDLSKKIGKFLEETQILCNIMGKLQMIK